MSILFRSCGIMLTLVLVAQPCSMSFARKLWAKRPGSPLMLFAFERNARIGFIDPTGKIVIKPTIIASIEDVGDFVSGVARVGDLGYIDQSGKWVIKQDVSPGEDFSEGLAVYRAEGKRGIRKFEPGNFVYRDYPGLKGFVDLAGNVVIKAAFADAGPFIGGLARAALDGYCHLVTGEGSWEGSPTSGYPSSCGGAPADAVSICKVGFINTAGNFTINPQFESARDFQENLAAVRMDGLWGFIDTSGTVAIPPRFEQAQSFQEGMAAVKVDGRWGFIDRLGLLTILPRFDEVEPFSDSLAVAREGKRYSYIDRLGQVVIDGSFQEVTSFVNGLAAVLLDERHVAYIDKTGKRVFDYYRKKR